MPARTQNISERFSSSSARSENQVGYVRRANAMIHALNRIDCAGDDQWMDYRGADRNIARSQLPDVDYQAGRHPKQRRARCGTTIVSHDTSCVSCIEIRSALVNHVGCISKVSCRPTIIKSYSAVHCILNSDEPFMRTLARFEGTRGLPRRSGAWRFSTSIMAALLAP